MPNLFRNAPERWHPDSDPTKAQAGALLRADNTVPDEVGARALRAGSETVYSGMRHQRVHSLWTPTLQETVYRMGGIDDRVYRYDPTTTDPSVTVLPEFKDFGITFDGEGDIAFADDAYQAFMARGKTKRKFDGVSLNNWGMGAPAQAPVLSAVTAVSIEIASFNGASHASPESPAWVTNEGTYAQVPGYDGVANASMSLMPNAGTGRASASKKWASDQNHFAVLGTAGGQTDLFDIRVWIEEPRKVDKVTIMFGLGTGTDPYLDDYYYYDFNLKDKAETDVKDAASQSVAAYLASVDRLLSPLTAQEITGIKRPEDAGVILRRIGKYAGSRSVERRDSLEASPAWGHFTVTRGQFTRVGQTAGRDWKTVRAMKVIYTAVPGSTEKIYFDNAVWAGGGNRALTGTYRVGVRFARKFKDAAQNEIYTELSPMSPISNEIVLNQQGLQITIGATTLAAKDPQADQMWVYLYGGFLDTFYRSMITSAFLNQGMTIDELTNPSGSNFQSKSERTRLTTHGFTRITGGDAGNFDLTVVNNKSEMDILIENEVFEPGSIGPPDNIIAIVGPWNGRMFVLTSEGWLYPSSYRNPSSFSVYHAIDLRRYGTPYWAVKTTAGGIYVGCSKDVIRIAGSGDESETHVTVDLYPEPINVANPPVDRSIAMDGNAIMFRSADGLMFLSGSSLLAVPEQGTSLLWRGYSRHGVNALNITSGRFRFAFDNHNIYALMTEGVGTDPTSLWRYAPAYQQWCRFTYPHTLLSLAREPDGSLLAGTTNGRVVELEIGTQDDGANIPVYILTPTDDGGNPLSRKVSVDFQLHCATGADTALVELIRDNESVAAETVSVIVPSSGVYRSVLSRLGKFLRLQLRITGSFSRLLFHAYNLTYRPVPQQVMAIDVGYIVPRNGNDVAWVVESEIDCVSTSSSLSLAIYKDDVLFRTLTVPTRPYVRTSYRTTMPRGTKARRLRFVYSTTNSAGSANPGFEPYGVRVMHRGSGQMIDMQLAQGDQGNV